MDHRTALKQDTVLSFRSDSGEVLRCTIESEIGRGASCIVYEASRTAATGDKTLYRVKEFYPYQLDITRAKDGALTPAADDTRKFDSMQEHFRNDFSRANRLYYSGHNYASMTDQLDVLSCNGTSYILSAYSSEMTLDRYRPQSLKECVSLISQVAYVLGNIHKQGYLYLDAKPGNVLVLDGYHKTVRLFDFDSLLPISKVGGNAAAARDAEDIRLSYSKGFSPVELQTARLSHIGPHTDVYSVGALLFYLLWGRAPEAPDCESGAAYDFSTMQYDHDKCDDRLFAALTDFFHNSLAVYYADRFQDMQTVLERLEGLAKYADPMIPRIFSTRITRPSTFFGRGSELEALDRLLSDPEHNLILISGMGGIGKSTFIREYLASRREHFDTILYIPYRGSIEATISHDGGIEINTLRQSEEMSATARYFDKKLQKMRELLRETTSILVIDNFTGEIDSDMPELLATDLEVVLLSRSEVPYENALRLHLDAISDRAVLRQIFERHLGRPIAEDERESFDQLITHTEGHTLVLELIAKQIASSHITLPEAAALTEKYGFSSIAPEKVDFEKDCLPSRDTIGNIVDAIFEADGLSPQKKVLMKAASLLGDAGMDINLFQDILQLSSKDDINDLIRDGWLMISTDTLLMHHVVREAVHRWQWTPEQLRTAQQLLTYFYTKIHWESTRNNRPVGSISSPAFIKADSSASSLTDGSTTSIADGLESPRSLASFFLPLNRLKELNKPKRRSGFSAPLSGDGEQPADCAYAPADMDKLRRLLEQSEDILEACKREPEVKKLSIYTRLHCITVLNAPPYQEDYILAEIPEIFSDIRADPELNKISELRGDSAPHEYLAIAIMKLYAKAVLIHADNKRFIKSENLLMEANEVAGDIHTFKAYALYYDMLSNYYDIRLDGFYYTDDPDEKQLLKDLFETTNKAIFYSRRRAMLDEDHLYAKNVLAKATLLIRSGCGTDRKIRHLLSYAKKVINESTSPYADVRLQYYLVCAWYFALIRGDAGHAAAFVKKALKLSDAITPTDMQRIENLIIPCANIYYELQDYDRAMALLYEGTRLCKSHANTDSYARLKKDLCDHLLEVGIAAQRFEQCQKFIELIELENEEIVDPENRVEIPDGLRDEVGRKPRGSSGDWLYN